MKTTYFALVQDVIDNSVHVIYLGSLTLEQAELQRQLLCSTGEHSDVIVLDKEQLQNLYPEIHTNLTTP